MFYHGFSACADSALSSTAFLGHVAQRRETCSSGRDRGGHWRTDALERADYAAIVTSIEFSESLQIGGSSEQHDFSVQIPKVCSRRPKVNDAILFDGKAHRISRVSDSYSCAMVTLTVQVEWTRSRKLPSLLRELPPLRRPGTAAPKR